MEVVCCLIICVIGDMLCVIYLYGFVVVGGLKLNSDIDLLVIIC